MPLPPFGVLGIDPIAPLPILTIPLAAGVASWIWHVPNLPGFAGIAVYAQAVTLSTVADARRGNVTADVLLR